MCSQHTEAPFPFFSSFPSQSLMGTLSLFSFLPSRFCVRYSFIHFKTFVTFSLNSCSCLPSRSLSPEGYILIFSFPSQSLTLLSVSCELVLTLALAPSWVSMWHLLKLKCEYSPLNLRILSSTICSIYTHDGASAKFRTNSQETDYRALARSLPFLSFDC